MGDHTNDHQDPRGQPGGASAPDGGGMRWATSRTLGIISEIAVLSPIRKGCPPGERRTYEEVLRATVANIARRHEQGLPTELTKVSAIHFGRIIVLRPEQYLVQSANIAIAYEDAPHLKPKDGEKDAIPKPIDDFHEDRSTHQASEPDFRSWVLTLVEFDGDLRSYMRDIARTLNTDFDNIFNNCDHYPGTKDFELFWQWIRRYQINTDLFYAAYPNLSVVRLKQLEAFKRRFDAFVAQVRSPQGARVRSIDDLFDQFLRENQQYAQDFPSPGGLFTADDNARES